MDNNNVPENDRFLVLTASEIQALMKLETATNRNYTNFTPLMAGGIDDFFGFKIIKIGNRREGGLKPVSEIRTCFAYQKDALGLVYSIAPKVMADYSVERTSNVVVGQMKLGADVLKTAGVVSIGVDTTAG